MTTSDDWSRGFALRLRKARRDNALSQDELARVLGLNRSTIANVERGVQNMSARQLVTVCAFLRIDPCWLLTGANHTDAPPTPVISHKAIQRLAAWLQTTGSQLACEADALHELADATTPRATTHAHEEGTQP